MDDGRSPLPEPTDQPTTVDRRAWLRRGALVAGATAGAAIALRPGTAAAADGDNLVLGTANSAESPTTLTVGADNGSPGPALALGNADGPALRLQALPSAWGGQLQVGEIAGTELGPVVGVDTPAGLTTTYLVTGVDLANVPSPFASEPRRVLDLRTTAGRAGVIRRSSATALAADGKLRAGQWIDIAVADTSPDYRLSAVFANLTVVRAGVAGYATVYAPGVRPATSSLNYAVGQTLSNAAFVGTGTVLGYHAIRLHTLMDAWFVLDVTGGVAAGSAQTPLAKVDRAAGARQTVVNRVRRAFGRLGR